MNLCRGQGYDGAGNVAGKYKGASSIISRQYPKPLFVHCKSHLWNLCVAPPCEIELVRNMMEHVKSVSNFFSVHPKRALLEQQVKKMLPSARHRHLLDVCRTRWVSRIDGLDVFVEIFIAIIGSFEIVKSCTDGSWTPASTDDARNPFYFAVSFEFIISIVIVVRILEFTRPLTKHLQSVSIDATEAMESILLIFSMLVRLKKDIDVCREDWYTEAVTLAGKLGTVPLQPQTVFIQRHRPNIPAYSPSEYYKRTLSIPFLDHLTSEMQRRFSPINFELLSAFYALPKVVVHDSSWLQRFMKFLSLYENDLPEQRYNGTELKTWEAKWKMFSGTLPSKLSEVLPLIDKLTFPNVYIALQLAATFPATSCSCERSISVLRRLKM